MKSFIILMMLAASTAASAASVDWSGVYRFEWVQVDRPSLGNPADRKSYGLNYLGLSPHIIVSDGFEITSKFDVLPNTDPAYSMSEAGQIWGQGTQNGAATGNANNTSYTKPPTSLAVRELYLNINQEYGSLLVGRAPFEFGLGMHWNAGNGPFDHWTTNADLMAYKFIVGNVFIMPMFSRQSVGVNPVTGTVDNTGAEHFVQDQTLQVQYDSEDTGSTLGLIYSRRTGSDSNNDVPIGVNGIGGAGAVYQGAYAVNTTGFMLGRKWDSFHIKIEADFMQGDTGVKPTISDSTVKINSYGVAIEMGVPQGTSKWEYGLRTGLASGDNNDPNSPTDGSFQFNRNYRVAQLMFRHRLGRFDILQTGLIRDTTNHSVQNSIDDETISNAMYFSPRVKYSISDRWDLNNTFTYGQLMAKSLNTNGFKKDLGIEWDIESVYKPRSNIQWVNDLGMLFPGAAFKGGDNATTDALGNSVGYQNGFTFGFESKIAITF